MISEVMLLKKEKLFQNCLHTTIEELFILLIDINFYKNKFDSSKELNV